MEHAYHAQGEYPIPRNLPRNIRYARVLLGAYSGRESELTAIHQYLYHHILAGADHPEIADALRGIAIAEMRHLDLLADVIRQLGLYPTYTFYQGTRRVRWNSGFIRYGRNLREMLDVDIAAERTAIEDYKRVLRCIPEAQIQALIERILLDEEEHLRVFTRLRQSI